MSIMHMLHHDADNIAARSTTAHCTDFSVLCSVQDGFDTQRSASLTLVCTNLCKHCVSKASSSDIIKPPMVVHHQLNKFLFVSPQPFNDVKLVFCLAVRTTYSVVTDPVTEM